MAAPPPHEGPCRRSGDGASHDDEIARLGRYRGLCSICRPLAAAEQKQRRAEGRPPASLNLPRTRDDEDGMRDEIKARTEQRGKLKAACQDLVGQAEKLEHALDERNHARLRAHTALHDFKETLTLVGRVAQSLVNVRAEPRDQ
jgi:hypothetical protein